MAQDTASGRWDELDADRQVFIRRCEKYSSYTIPKICPPLGYNQNNDELQHDYQSVGAQATNHLVNKMMLSLFAPSRPFFRLDPNKKLQEQMDKAGIKASDLSDRLAKAEMDAVRQMDTRPIRPKKYEVLKHLVITGNVLEIYGKDNIRVLGIKNYCVKRGMDGETLEIVTKETVNHKSLDPKIVAYLGKDLHPDAKDCVVLYKWLCKMDDGRFELTTWVDSKKLPDDFNGKYTAKDNPYSALTWDLATGDDYGTGLVEDYAGDFAALSMMSKGTVEAALLASEFRWLVNPAAMTKPLDFERSTNGAVLPGVAGDITLVQSGDNQNLSTNVSISEKYVQRIGQGFLLSSATTRDAERVTAEEIRMNAEELENSLGGVYSRIAVDLQVPMAYWLMKLIDKSIIGSDLEPTIVTGLAALSRSGDRDNLMLFLQDVAQLAALANTSPAIAARLRIPAIQGAFAAARGLLAATYILTDQEFQQQQKAMQQQQNQNMAAQAGTEAAATQIAQQGTSQGNQQ